MPKLKPLEQWYCDTCGEIIERVDDGCVVWAYDRVDRCLLCDFRIIHQNIHSPGYPGRSCDDGHQQFSLAVSDWLGDKGMIKALSILDWSRVRDVHEFVEFLRRLRLPYYEEARWYWDRAEGEFFEVRDYTADALKRTIENYEDEE